MIKKLALIKIFSFFLFFPVSASAINYCNQDGKSYSAYFAPRVGAETQEIKNYQTSLENIYRKLEIGDKLELFVANGSGVTKAFSSCYPGCPPQGIAQQFLGLGGSCKATVAKRDQINFKNNFLKNASQIINGAKNKTAGYVEIIKTLGVIDAHSKAKQEAVSEYFIVSSMFNDVSINRNTVDKFFVMTVQDRAMIKKFPSMQVMGMSLNPELIELWKDLYAVNGQTFKYN